MAGKHMILGLMLEGFGRSDNDWRHPNAAPNASFNFDFNRRQALIAEEGKLDFVFITDTHYIEATSPPYRLARFEAMTLLSGLAATTSRIGIVATATTTYSEPFNVARQFLSADHMAGGRVGWNVVTSDPSGTAENFGRAEQLAHGERFKVANEYLDVVQGLWDSFEDDALVQDKATGQFLDPAKLHTLNHKGTYFQVKGPLNCPRSPQGQPVIFTASLSADGREFAAARADALFFSTDTMEEAQVFYGDTKSRMAKYGRDPDSLSILPTTKPVIGGTEEEAERKYRERLGTVSLKVALDHISKTFGYHDFTQYDPDGPFPDVIALGMNGFQGHVQRIARIARDEQLTLRQLAHRVARPRGTFVGTPETLADKMQAWVEQKAVDGFILGETTPGEFRNFVDEVLPILRRRGLFRTDYAGRTLRDHLRLPRPRNRFAKGAKARRAMA